MSHKPPFLWSFLYLIFPCAPIKKYNHYHLLFDYYYFLLSFWISILARKRCPLAPLPHQPTTVNGEFLMNSTNSYQRKTLMGYFLFVASVPNLMLMRGGLGRWIWGVHSGLAIFVTTSKVCVTGKIAWRKQIMKKQTREGKLMVHLRARSWGNHCYHLPLKILAPNKSETEFWLACARVQPVMGCWATMYKFIQLTPPLKYATALYHTNISLM